MVGKEDHISARYLTNRDHEVDRLGTCQEPKPGRRRTGSFEGLGTWLGQKHKWNSRSCLQFVVEGWQRKLAEIILKTKPVATHLNRGIGINLGKYLALLRAFRHQEAAAYEFEYKV